MGRAPERSGRPDRASVQAIRAALCLIACVQVGQASADTVYVTLEKEGVVATFDGETGIAGERVLAGRRPRGILAGSKEGERTLQIWLDRWYMGVKTADWGHHQLAPGDASLQLGCSAADGGEQHWELVEAKFAPH